jgi:hypothetical chaperone protein
MAAQFQKLGVDPTLFKRLHDTIDMEMGHDIAFAVEAGKIRANVPDADQSAIDLRTIERDLWAQMGPNDLSQILSPHAETVRQAALQTLVDAQLAPNDIGQIVFVGGSSLMHVIIEAMTDLFPDATLERTEAFTAVADGLAIAASR